MKTWLLARGALVPGWGLGLWLSAVVAVGSKSQTPAYRVDRLAPASAMAAG